ncbi:hypothetical protein MMC17_004455 [Xylographa soralifera]|nr:hypothetical protein [Xylographa soralifera]
MNAIIEIALNDSKGKFQELENANTISQAKMQEQNKAIVELQARFGNEEEANEMLKENLYAANQALIESQVRADDSNHARRVKDLDTEKERLAQAKRDDIDRVEIEKASFADELNQLMLDYSSHRFKATENLKKTTAKLEGKLQTMKAGVESNLEVISRLYEKENTRLQDLEKTDADRKEGLHTLTNLYDEGKTGLEYMVHQQQADKSKIEQLTANLNKSSKKLLRREDMAKQSTQRTQVAMIKAIDPNSSYSITNTMADDYLTNERSLFSPASISLAELSLPTYDDTIILSPIKWYGSTPSSLVTHWAACYLGKLENEQVVSDLLSRFPPTQWRETIPWIVSSCTVLLLLG